MKYHPNQVCFKVFKRYMSLSEQKFFDKLLLQYKDTRHKHFFNAMIKHFDIEKLRTHPLIWQDIWLYNYIKLETSERLRLDGLFKKYVKEAFIYDDADFSNYLKNMQSSDKTTVQSILNHHASGNVKSQ